MTGIFGLLGLNDNNRSYVNVIGQSVVRDAAQRYLAEHNAEMEAIEAIFIERTTSDFAFRYKLPGGGRLQRRGGQAQSGATKAAGSWDVGLPLEDFGAQIAGDDVSMAYMSLPELQLHLDSVRIQDLNTRRYEMLKALLNNTARTFVDPINGSITVRPLALASDSVLYPPVMGSETEATDTHHLESGFAASAISDTNNPYVTIVDELEEHFGSNTGGENIVTFINNAQIVKTKALSDFEEVPDSRIRLGDSVNVPTNLPRVPGKIIGRVSGTWVVSWRWIPANYMVALHLDEAAPLLKRVDPPETGLGMGLQLVSTDAAYPMQAAHYRNRFGIGVGNRLNGVVMELGVGGTYSIPSGYD
jgi:hypothetical protein